MRVRNLLYSLALALCLTAFAPDGSRAQLQQGTNGGTQLRSPDVVYVPTPHEAVDAMLKVAKVSKSDIVYDLGSGDGRIPIAAVQKYNAQRAVGIDINPVRIQEAEANLKAANVGDR